VEENCPTIDPQHQGSWCSLNTAFGDRIGDHTGVVAHIRGFHFGDVEVARLLGHKSPCVLDDKRRVLVEDPREGHFWEQSQAHKSKTHRPCPCKDNVYCISSPITSVWVGTFRDKVMSGWELSASLLWLKTQYIMEAQLLLLTVG